MVGETSSPARTMKKKLVRTFVYLSTLAIAVLLWACVLRRTEQIHSSPVIISTGASVPVNQDSRANRSVAKNRSIVNTTSSSTAAAVVATNSTERPHTLYRRKGSYIPYTFDASAASPASAATDAEVAGWERDKSRDVRRYVRPRQPTSRLRPRSPPPATLAPDLLVLICSAPAHAELRKAVRRTWAGYIGLGGRIAKFRSKVVYVFVMGVGANNTVQEELREESDTFGDILVEDFVDSYFNLTLKTVFALKFAVETTWKQPPRFVLKCDDDTFVNVPRLMNTLLQLSGSTLPLFMLGYVHAQIGVSNKLQFNPRPFRSSNVKTTDERRRKYLCPRYLFNGDRYPQIASGSGYAMDNSAVSCLYGQALRLPFFHLEDVFVTGFAGQECDVPMIHNPGFRYANTTEAKQLKFGSDTILIHYVQPKTMDALHKRYLALNGMKEQDVKKPK